LIKTSGIVAYKYLGKSRWKIVESVIVSEGV
jgi:hypothetical protein